VGEVKRRTPPVFNSPFELGIRMVYLLQALAPHRCDLQKLVLLDYAIVYSADLNGPNSLHTPIPFRGAELMSRRELIEQGLYLMSTRGLVAAALGADGITYFAGEAARVMTSTLTSAYLRELEHRCEWVAEQYGQADSTELTATFAASGHLWGAELESVTRHGGGAWRLF
jgi:hypothetical protein